MELICKHCGKKVKSRAEASDRQWTVILMSVRENDAQVAGGEGVFCPDTPRDVVEAFIDAVGTAVMESRILE